MFIVGWHVASASLHYYNEMKNPSRFTFEDVKVGNWITICVDAIHSINNHFLFFRVLECIVFNLKNIKEPLLQLVCMPIEFIIVPNPMGIVVV
jgi:hypothetical protein